MPQPITGSGFSGPSGPIISDNTIIDTYFVTLRVGTYDYFSSSTPLTHNGTIEFIDCSGSCDGVPNSGLQYDACGVCGGDGSTCSGCDGIPNSIVSYDDCGVCGGINACIDECGVPFGDGTSCRGCDGVIAFPPLEYDGCGVCGGRNLTCNEPTTFFIPITFGSASTDDLLFGGTGICEGNSIAFVVLDSSSHRYVLREEPSATILLDTVVDSSSMVVVGPDVLVVGNYSFRCQIHGGDPFFAGENGEFSVVDVADCLGCDGILGSGAVYDDCGVCVPRNGNFNACVGGCDQMPYSMLEYDVCGVCGGNASTCPSCIVSSTGEPGLIDACGLCLQPSDPTFDMSCADFCGVPNGNNSTCTICTDDQGQDAIVDVCGNCGGNGVACTPQTLEIPVTQSQGISHATSDLLEPNPPGVACLGDTVRWVFLGLHSLVSGLPTDSNAGQLFMSGTRSSGQTFEFSAWPGPGDYNYFDSARMPNLPNRVQTIRIEDCMGCDGLSRSRLEYDVCGVCGGDGLSCVNGCDGVFGSGLQYDACGVCGGDGSTCVGCDGVFGSGLEYDVCGICGGDGSVCTGCDGVVGSGATVDQCGVCRQPGDPARDTTCADCNGVPNGSAVVDSCGVCGGNNRCSNRSNLPLYIVGAAGGVIIVAVIVGCVSYRSDDPPVQPRRPPPKKQEKHMNSRSLEGYERAARRSGLRQRVNV